MAFWSALRRKPEEDDLYEEEEYEGTYDYEEEGEDWQEESRVQPIHTGADLEIALVTPLEYKDASVIADQLRDMKMVVLNLEKTDHEVARRLLDFLSGVVYTENGHIMKVASRVYVASPYFVDLMGLQSEDSTFYF